MSSISQGIRKFELGGAAQNPVIYNVAVTLAATEYSQALPTGTKKFLVRNRESGKLNLSYAMGTSGTVYVTLSPGTVYSESDLNFSGSLYFQSTKAAQVVEIVAWT